MAPNLPAPMRPTLSGLPWESRSCSFAYRFIYAASLCRKLRFQGGLRRPVFPRQRNLVMLEQAVVREALDRREVAVRDVLGPLEAADVIGYRAQTQIDIDAVPRR